VACHWYVNLHLKEKCYCVIFGNSYNSNLVAVVDWLCVLLVQILFGSVGGHSVLNFFANISIHDCFVWSQAVEYDQCGILRCILLMSSDSAPMLETVITSEMFLNFYETTWCSIPEDCHLHACCLEFHLEQKLLDETGFYCDLRVVSK